MPFKLNPFTGRFDEVNPGDVVGPDSSVDGNFASFDGTTGKLIQDSGFTDSDFLKVANDLSDLNSASTARTNIGLEIGTDVEAWDADLDALAALSSTGIAVRTAADTWDTQDLSVVIQTFTTSGTYTPTAGVQYAILEVLGAGGGGAGSPSTGGSQASAGGAGGGGGYARTIASAATIGASQTVTIGSGGAGGVGNNGGGNGGSSSIGALCAASGGNGGTNGSAGAFNILPGGLAGSGSTGDITMSGGGGGTSIAFGSNDGFLCGNGGTNYFGSSARGFSALAGGFNGINGDPGAGGSGSGNTQNEAQRTGGDGGDGLAIVTEFVLS